MRRRAWRVTGKEGNKMQYRKDKLGNDLSILGQGCMRFPRDKAETRRLIATAIDGGINFFDTAYIYAGSEVALGDALAALGRRRDVYIATKLPFALCKSAEDFDKFFEKQLERLQTDYVDYYFMHNISTFAQWETLRGIGIVQWIEDKKSASQIRQVGFSFHGTNGEFLKILDAYDWEFCMIQYNYYDENYQAGRGGLLAAAEKGVAVFVMEPLLGGKLATGLPKQAVDIFAKADASLTPADWALRWLWNQKEVTMVLNGMGSTQIVESNLVAADNFRPLDEEAFAVYSDVVDVFKKSYRVNCTGCNYCLPCPKGINIPACLSVYNTSYAQSYFTAMFLYMAEVGVVTESSSRMHTCNECGKCERACPQNIPIRKWLKKAARRLEPLPLRMVFAVVRRFAD